MNKKRYFYLILLLPIIIILAIFLENEEYYEKRVLRVPPGFVSLNEVSKSTGYILEPVFWETRISIMDCDFIDIFGTSVKDDNFLVRYKDDYYVNEEKYMELVNIASATLGQRNKIYKIGDIVGLRETGNSYFMKVSTLNIIKSDDNVVCELKFTIVPSVSEEKSVEFFDYIETENGMKYNDFTLIDSETVHIKIPTDEKISTIVLKSPYFASDCIRKISVN